MVYEALDRQLGRSVAFKILRSARTRHEPSAEWILKEAEAVARLDHPAIVTLHDVGRCESGPYLVEELLHGRTLEERLRAGPLPAHEVVALGLELARGLAHAHAHGILHRDLKPGNVFLTDDGRVKLLDFGLAHLLGTRSVHGAGTPAYMAPEHLRGEPPDARADVFALGATLFEALAGKAPFDVKEGRSAALDRGPPPRAPDGTPPALAALVERCLSRDPLMRPASGQAVVEELMSVQRTLGRVDGRGGAAPARGAPRRTTLRRAAIAVGVATIASGGVYLGHVRGRYGIESAGRTVAPSAPRSIAVLPFADMSQGQDQEYFSDGIAEEILGALAHVPGLKVIGRTSSFAFKGKNEELSAIARKLNVGSLLEGSVRRDGDRVRVTAKLIDAADGAEVWSESFDRHLAGVFAVQDEIARAVVAALRARLLPATHPAAPTPQTTNPDAYSQYLLGRHHVAAFTREGVLHGIAALERSVALDPHYAPAWAWLGYAQYWLVQYEATGAEQADFQRRALASAERAAALDGTLPDVLAIRGFLRLATRWDWQGAEADLEKAVASGSGDPLMLRTLGRFVLAGQGRVSEGLATIQRAVDIDPLSGPVWGNLASVLYHAGRLEESMTAARRAIELSPASPLPAAWLTCALVQTGRGEEALAVARSIRETGWRLVSEALAEASLGHVEAADRALGEAERTKGDTMAYQIAVVHAWRGHRDEALRWLARAVRQQDGGLTDLLIERAFGPLHGDPRFRRILEAIRLPPDAQVR